MPRRAMNFHVEITRNYGSHTIKFGISELQNVSSGSERRAHFNNLVSQLEDQIEVYERTHLPHVDLVTFPKPHEADDTVLNQGKPTALVVEHRNGRREVSLKVMQYQKHGVPVYSDTCITDLPLAEYELGEHDLTHLDLTATVDIVDGKPKRVLSIK